MFCNFYIFKTPVADSACDVLNRRINHNPGGARSAVITTIACPFFAIKSLTAENLFSMYTPANHCALPLVFNVLKSKYCAEQLSLAKIIRINDLDFLGFYSHLYFCLIQLLCPLYFSPLQGWGIFSRQYLNLATSPLQ